MKYINLFKELASRLTPEQCITTVMLEEITKLREERNQQAAVIEQMQDACLFFIGWAERNAMWDKCDSSYYLAKKAIALQPCSEVLNKVRADAVRKAFKLMMDGRWRGDALDVLADRMERGEA